jgi:hypothetical protein
MGVRPAERASSSNSHKSRPITGRTVATLRGADVPFVVAGSIATWARGGPEPQNDLDVMLKPEDAEAALRALTGAGMRTEHPPEEWLYKPGTETSWST